MEGRKTHRKRLHLERERNGTRRHKMGGRKGRGRCAHRLEHPLPSLFIGFPRRTKMEICLLA